MRLLLASGELSLAGGVESYLRRLAAGLAGRGHELMIVGGGGPGPGWPPQAELRVVAGCGRFGAPRRAAGEVLRLAEGFAPEVVHLHEIENHPLALALAERWPVVRHAHVDFSCAAGGARFLRRTRRPCFRSAGLACLWHHYFDRCRPGWDPRWGLWSYRRARGALRTWRGMPRLIVASEFMRRSLLACGFRPEQVTTLPYFVEDVPETGAPEASGRAGAGEPAALFVGRIMPEKGLGDLLRAMARARRRWRLAVVGDGPARPAAERLAARLGLADRVEFAGWQAETGPFYDRAALLAVPSLWPEPFGLVGLEAMARGLPVAAYRSGGIPEWLEADRTGLLVEPGDVAGLAAAVDALVADPDRARAMGAAGRERQRTIFGPARHLDRLEGILREAALRGP